MSDKFDSRLYRLIEKNDTEYTDRQLLSTKYSGNNVIKTFTSTNLTLNTIGSGITKEIMDSIVKNEENIYQFNGNLEAATPPISDSRNVDPITGNSSSTNENSINMTGFNMNRGFKKAKFFRGSLRLGRCEVLNPPHQFHSNDDVRSNPYYPFYGRIYNDTIRANFPIVVIEPGRVIFNTNPGALALMMAGSSADVKRYIKGNRGIAGGIIGALGTIKRTTMRFFTGFMKIYKFRPDMHLFIKYFNQMAYEVADYLGLIKVGFLGDIRNTRNKFGEHRYDTASVFDLKKIIEEENATFAQKATEIFDDVGTSIKDTFNEVTSSFFGSDENGTETDNKDPVREAADAKYFTNINEDNLYNYLSGSSESHKEIVNIVDYDEDTTERIELSPDDIGMGTNVDDEERNEQSIGNYLGATNHVRMSEFLPMYDMLYSAAGDNDVKDGRKENRTFSMFIGKYNYLQFLLQSNASISESVSNSTSPHPLESAINSKAEGSYSRKMSMHIDTSVFNDDLSSVSTAVIDSVKTHAATTVQAATMGEMGSMMAGHGGRVALPEIYQSSSFNRSVSLSFEFWSPRGDTLSCFENTIIQLLTWIVLASPIQAGKFSYMSPFNMRINAMGLFNINLAMVESLNIQRGESKNDKTAVGIFRTIKVDVSIKDLLPATLLSMDSGLFSILHRHNDSMRQYLMLLGNIPFAKQRNFLDNLAFSARRFSNSLANKFSGHNIAAAAGESWLFRGVRTVFGKAHSSAGTTGIDVFKS